MGTRRAALVATAISVPFIILLALIFGSLFQGGSDSSAGSDDRVDDPLVVSGPAHVAKQEVSCNQVLQTLPVQLGPLAPRVVRPEPPTPYVVAWGAPAVVLKCGVAKPAALKIGSSEQAFNAGNLRGPFFLVSRGRTGNTYTIVDRAPFISIEIPGSYQAGPLLATLVGAIGKALPKAVCSTDSVREVDVTRLCTRRVDR